MRSRCIEVAATLDKAQPLDKDQMETVVRAILEKMELPEGYLGWMMVALASAFWQDQVAAAPYERRLFLLPHCLKHAEAGRVACLFPAQTKDPAHLQAWASLPG